MMPPPGGTGSYGQPQAPGQAQPPGSQPGNQPSQPRPFFPGQPPQGTLPSQPGGPQQQFPGQPRPMAPPGPPGLMYSSSGPQYPLPGAGPGGPRGPMPGPYGGPPGAYRPPGPPGVMMPGPGQGQAGPPGMARPVGAPPAGMGGPRPAGPAGGPMGGFPQRPPGMGGPPGPPGPYAGPTGSTPPGPPQVLMRPPGPPAPGGASPIQGHPGAAPLQGPPGGSLRPIATQGYAAGAPNIPGPPGAGPPLGLSGPYAGPPQGAANGPYAAPGPGQVAQQLGSMSLGISSSPVSSATHPLAPNAPGTQSARRVYPDAYGAAATAGSALPPPVAHGGAMAAPLPAAAPAGPTSRIDPNQIPRPVGPVEPVVFVTRVSGGAALPPPATSTFVAKDLGNCSPRVMRCTMNTIPTTSELVGTGHMPLALLVQPLALPHPQEEPIQVVDFGEMGPVRCSRCKAYINPFMKFADAGRKFTCNLCGNSNETPREYICNLGPDGRRRDADERPELCKGSVEFVAPKEYMVRPPMPFAIFVVVDVSLTAVQSGAVAAACSAIARALEDLPQDERTLVGVATFDSNIHFYNLDSTLSQPAMLVVPNIAEPYTPLPTNLLVPITQGKAHLESLLESIPNMFRNTRVGDSAFGSAVQAGLLALKATGGKLLVFQSVLPSVGIGALSGREGDGRSGGATVGEKEAHKLLLPADKTFHKMAVEAAEYQVCIDLFLAGQGYMDVASLAVLPRTTGGSVYSYQPWNAVADSAKLHNDLRWNLTRPQGLEAVLRVRCSAGLQVVEYSGSFCRRIPTDVDLPAVDCDKAIMVTFKHDDKFAEGTEAAFQCALLYTTVSGQRRIRVHTLSLPTATSLGNVFRGADLDAQFTYMLKSAAEEVPKTPLVQVREKVGAQCVDILYAYRKYCATSSASGQLILPEALKLLPLYTLALNKSVGLRADVRIDERSAWVASAASLPAPLAVPLVYPRMFAVHSLAARRDGDGILPPTVALTSEKLDHEGVFLLETGEDAFIWAGKAASPEVLLQLFGVRSMEEAQPNQLQLQELPNDLSRRLNEVVNEIRRQRCSYLRLRVLRRGDPLEGQFFAFLVEDRSQAGMSYVEFLCHVHRQIQNKFA